MNKETGLKETKKIKRRNFFYYLGASAFGIYTVSKYPVEIVKSMITGEKKHASASIQIKENSMAVKRDNKRTINNG